MRVEDKSEENLIFIKRYISKQTWISKYLNELKTCTCGEHSIKKLKENIEFCMGRKKTDIEEILKGKNCIMSLKTKII